MTNEKPAFCTCASFTLTGQPANRVDSIAKGRLVSRQPKAFGILLGYEISISRRKPCMTMRFVCLRRQKTSKTGPRGPSCFFGVHIPQRSAAVCTGASHSANVSASAAVTVIEQPAISSEVT